MVSDRAVIFHIYVHRGKTFSLVTKSRSSVKVIYQGHSFRNNGCCRGISVSQTLLVIYVLLMIDIKCLIVWCLTPSQQYFIYIAAASAPIHAFLESFLTSTLQNILSKPLAAFPHNSCQNNRQR